MTALSAALVGALEFAAAYAAFDHGAARYAVGATVLAGLLALCVFRPYPTLLGFAGVWGVTHVLASGGGVSVSKVVGITVPVGFGLALLRLRGEADTARIPLALTGFGVFAAVYAVGEAYTPFRSEGLSDMSKVIGGIILAFTAYQLANSRQRLLSLCRVVGVAGAIVAGIALAQFALLKAAPGIASAIFGSNFYLITHSGGGSAVRVNSTLSGAGETAGFLLVCAGFALLRYALGRDGGRARSDTVTLVLIASGIIATLTRTGVVGLVVLLMIWAFLWRSAAVGPAGLRVRLILVASAAAVLLFQTLGASTIAARIQDLNPSTSGAGFATGRGAVWSNELHTLRSADFPRILLGSGPHSSFTNVFLPQWRTFREFAPHDLFLWLVLESGLIGLVIYGAALLGVAKAFLVSARRSPYSLQGQVGAVAFATTLAFCLDSAFHNTQASAGSGWYFMLFVGAALRMSRLPSDTVGD